MRLQRGFTLLELLIAIAIFALLALATYRMFDSVMQTDQATRVQEQRMRELVRAMGALERDLTQAVERPVRDELGDNRGAFLSEGENDQIVEFTRGGWRNPLGQARSRLQRVRWSLSGETLERRYWLVLDRAQDSKPPHKLLQEDVKFANLGLVVIDEEHRFGVRQKEQLKALRSEVDILTLTATPIPRTLNMAVSGMRDLSIIATPPARRLSVRTFVMEQQNAVI
ncbi:type II secretion system minor pseudopilin GspJ, partial [Pseudomonas aeruginosa]|uniref:type II secretion system minor pseudopilin GspJ n=1 Tax=Pseudomonas aeruginosa TaxID=287 RepID=UPI00396A4985